MTRSVLNDDCSITVIAPAKVNLFLHITGRRANGYHELESLFAFTHKGDEVTVSKNEGLSLEVVGPYSDELISVGGGGEQNLVHKAAHQLAQHACVAPKARITLRKNLPVASGIGGGSSDAAAALLALRELWKLNCSDNELAEIALELGADVPACLSSDPLYVRGIGEQVQRRSLPKPYGILLVNPGVAISTPAVFKSFKEDLNCTFDASLGANYNWPSDSTAFVNCLSSDLHNALQAPAQEECPEITTVLKSIKACEGVNYAAMSGSGATCFGLFESIDVAAEAAKLVEKARPNWWVMADQLQAGYQTE